MGHNLNTYFALNRLLPVISPVSVFIACIPSKLTVTRKNINIK